MERGSYSGERSPDASAMRRMSSATGGSRERNRSRPAHSRAEVPTLRAGSSRSDSPAGRRQPLSLGPQSAQAMNGHWTVWAVVASVSLLMDGGGAGAAGPTAFPASQVLEVTATPLHVNVMARETPLADVLKAIGQQAGVKIVLRSELNTPVTATLAN